MRRFACAASVTRCGSSLRLIRSSVAHATTTLLPTFASGKELTSPPRYGSFLYSFRSYSTSSSPLATAMTPEALTTQSVTNITAFNFEKEIVKSNVPTLLVFGMDSAPESKTYTAAVKAQVIERNKKEGSVVVRLATVNCERELAIAKQFRVDQFGIPLTFFLFKGQMIDRAGGVLEEVHVRNAIDAFLTVVRTKLSPLDNTLTERAEQQQRLSEDEENPLTLIKKGMQMLQDQKKVEISKAVDLFNKALEQCKEPIADLKKSLGVGQKKVTPEMHNKLKENVFIQASAKANAMLAICELSSHKLKKAQEHTQLIRNEYPWAIKEFREIADAVTRVEMMILVDFDLTLHNYGSLLKKSEAVNDPDQFYTLHLRLAVAHYLEKKPHLCIEELLKLIRAEPKLGKSPKNGETSPARKLILMVFEALGPDDERVIEGRRKLSTYLF